jgi:hypothetical protein
MEVHDAAALVSQGDEDEEHLAGGASADNDGIRA